MAGVCNPISDDQHLVMYMNKTTGLGVWELHLRPGCSDDAAVKSTVQCDEAPLSCQQQVSKGDEWNLVGSVCAVEPLVGADIS